MGVILQDPSFSKDLVRQLPDYIRKENDFDKFKRLIKTHYFREACSDLS